MNRDGRTGSIRNFSKEGAFPSIPFDEMHVILAHHGEHHARKAGARAEIDDVARTMGRDEG
jgi:hypothetical protein